MSTSLRVPTIIFIGLLTTRGPRENNTMANNSVQRSPGLGAFAYFFLNAFTRGLCLQKCDSCYVKFDETI